MKVLLVNPSRIHVSGGKEIRVGLPAGLMYVAAALEQAGHEVRVFDFLVSRDIIFQKINDEITRYGVSDDSFIDFLKREKPDVVGITCPSTVQVSENSRVSKIVRSVYPSVPIVVGGPHFSVAGVEFMNDNPQIDIAVVGEGEVAMCEILEALKGGLQNVRGIIFRENGQIVATETRGFLPLPDLLPAYHLWDVEASFALLERGIGSFARKEKRSACVITSRGCPYNCVFCSIHLHMGKMWRPYSPEFVLKHIDFLVKNYRIKHISFIDDNLTLNKARFVKILDGLLERNYGFTWDTPNGIRAETLLDEDLVRKMKKSGCIEARIGVESGVQDVLDKIVGKNLDLKTVVRGAKICKKAGLRLGACFVIGFPGEKMKDIMGTVRFAAMLRRKYRVEPGLMLATPLFGTRLYKICKENNYLAKEMTAKNLAIANTPMGESMIKTGDFTPNDLHHAAVSLDRRLFMIKLYEALISPPKLLAAIKKR